MVRKNSVREGCAQDYEYWARMYNFSLTSHSLNPQE